MTIHESARPRPQGQSRGTVTSGARARWLLVVLFAVGLAAATGMLLRDTPGHSEPPAYRFSQHALEGSSAGLIELSADGTRLVFHQDGQLWIRPTHGGPRQLVTVDLAGGPAVVPPPVFGDNGADHLPLAVSTNGRYVVFLSSALSLVGGPPVTDLRGPYGPVGPAYLRDTLMGKTTRIGPLDLPSVGKVWVESAQFTDDRTLLIQAFDMRETADGPVSDDWYSVNYPGRYLLLDIETGQARAALSLPFCAEFGHCMVVPVRGNGDQLIVEDQRGLHRLTISTGAVAPIPSEVPIGGVVDAAGQWVLGSSCTGPFLIDTLTGKATFVGQLPNGVVAPGGCLYHAAAMSADGKTVAFVAQPDTPADHRRSVFIHDVAGKQTYLVSTVTGGDYLECALESQRSAFDRTTITRMRFSGRGDTVVFESCARNLVGAPPITALPSGTEDWPYQRPGWTTYIVQIAPFAQLTHRRVAVGITRE
jgi:hypothetical protein